MPAPKPDNLACFQRAVLSLFQAHDQCHRRAGFSRAVVTRLEQATKLFCLESVLLSTDGWTGRDAFRTLRFPGYFPRTFPELHLWRTPWAEDRDDKAPARTKMGNEGDNCPGFIHSLASWQNTECSNPVTQERSQTS